MGDYTYEVEINWSETYTATIEVEAPSTGGAEQIVYDNINKYMEEIIESGSQIFVDTKFIINARPKEKEANYE